MKRTTCGVLGVVLLTGVSIPAMAQTCVVARAQIVSDLAAGASPEELAAKYAGCVAVEQPTATAPGVSLSSESIINTGSTYFEAIKSCGYHPQREEANCTVEIRQRYGFGGPICQAPGSHEYLLLCVDLGGGLVPIHTNGVHVQDESLGEQPSWSFSATIQSNPALLRLPNNGRTLKGRVILSWALPPTNCNYRPIWGNQSDFRFRLDP